MESVVTTAAPSPGFWAGKRVLVTGHTGFKGSWLTLWLERLGAQVHGIALPPPTGAPSLFTLAQVAQHTHSHLADIRDAEALARLVRQCNPDIVFHLAAQALVRESYQHPAATFATNVQGTVNVLDALRHTPNTRCVVAVTTDKVYDNQEWAYPYRETDALGGHDPYSASKAACELVIDSYRKSFFVANNVCISSARAGNVIGGGDWSADRLIPDAVHAWSQHQTLHVRRPNAIRPWQHVLEPLHGYLVLAEKTWHNPSLTGAYNLGPLPHEASTVRQVLQLAQAHWAASPADAPTTTPLHFAEQAEGPHEAGLLALDTARARHLLGVVPRWPLATAVARTLSWYRQQLGGADARQLCEADLDMYEQTP
jgi:CDP-glucose 4,6-dehydratase